MKAIDVIKNAERITLAHLYNDGTALYDILVGDKAYSIRVSIQGLNKIRPGIATLKKGS